MRPEDVADHAGDGPGERSAQSTHKDRADRVEVDQDLQGVPRSWLSATFMAIAIGMSTNVGW